MTAKVNKKLLVKLILFLKQFSIFIIIYVTKNQHKVNTFNLKKVNIFN